MNSYPIFTEDWGADECVFNYLKLSEINRIVIQRAPTPDWCLYAWYRKLEKDRRTHRDTVERRGREALPRGIHRIKGLADACEYLLNVSANLFKLIL